MFKAVNQGFELYKSFTPTPLTLQAVSIFHVHFHVHLWNFIRFFSFLAYLSCVGANEAPGLWSESFTPLTVQVSVFYVTYMFIHESSFDTFTINNNRHMLMSPLWSASFKPLTVQAVSVFYGRHESSFSTNINHNIRHISGCKADF